VETLIYLFLNDNYLNQRDSYMPCAAMAHSTKSIILDNRNNTVSSVSLNHILCVRNVLDDPLVTTQTPRCPNQHSPRSL
jgi:hypothetical protein